MISSELKNLLCLECKIPGYKMSLRKFMHKRNKYKEEPNFKQLAILYPEFREIATNVSFYLPTQM